MPFDFQFSRQPEIAAMMRNACAYTFRQSYQVLFDDFVIRKLDIQPFLRESNIQLHWLLGAAHVYGDHNATPGFYNSTEIAEFLKSYPASHFRKCRRCGRIDVLPDATACRLQIAEAANGLRFGTLKAVTAQSLPPSVR